MGGCGGESLGKLVPVANHGKTCLMKILYAEDDGALRQILKHQLEKWGYTVLAVSDGAEAWEVLQRNDCPQLVLLDWEMPKYHGTELCQMVRESDGGEDCELRGRTL